MEEQLDERLIHLLEVHLLLVLLFAPVVGVFLQLHLVHEVRLLEELERELVPEGVRRQPTGPGEVA